MIAQPFTDATDLTADGSRRWVFPMVAAAVIFAIATVAWQTISSRGLPDRDVAIWHASQAVTAYTRLRQAITAGTGDDAIPRLADAFNEAVMVLDETGLNERIDPAVDALVQQLDTDRKRWPALVRPLDDPGGVQVGQPVPPDDSVELARLTEAVNQETATANRQPRLFAVLYWAIALVTSLSIIVLIKQQSALRAARRAIDSANARLREASEAAERAEAAKSLFIATAGHGIRAPVDIVLSLSDTLLEQRLEPSQRDIGVRIREAGGNVLRVLDDVLDLSAMESGNLTIDERPFSPEAVTAAAVIRIEARARAKGLTIVAIPSPGLPRMVLGDPDRIGRILFRLTTNAVKFTDKGGVSLQVLCVERAAGQATIEWVVTDTGAGIDPDRLGGLFETAGSANAIGHAGTGLGLAVCHRLVTRMGGTIEAESTLGEGSRFRVRLTSRVLPAGAGSTATPASALALRERLRVMGRRPRLLMAEDTPAGQFILRQFLAREGIVPDVVADGRAAVLAAEAERYDVICMDLRMPEMDGLEAARRIRSGRGPSAATPIIAVTASTSASDMRACEEAGMSMFVAKPVRRDILLNAILAALTEPNNETAANAETEPGVQASQSVN